MRMHDGSLTIESIGMVMIRWVGYADDPLIRDDRQGGVCCIFAWCQERYLTIFLVIKYSFGELMILLVTEDFRVLKIFLMVKIFPINVYI